jgi:hypothetical protein
MFRATTFLVLATAFVSAEEEAYAQPQQYDPYQQQYQQPQQYEPYQQPQYQQPQYQQYQEPQYQQGGGYGQQQQYAADPYQQQYAQPVYHAPATVYPTPAPTTPYIEAAAATPPPDFHAPGEPYPNYHPPRECNEKCKPNSAKYMAYVCSSLYASALKWGNNNCKGYYAVENAYNKNSLYQARLCTYWTQRSVMRVVTSCFIEAHLRNEFVMKHGKEGPGIWFCRYKEFVDQVLDCYKSSLKYYPLGAGMNDIEGSVAALYTPNKDDMPPFQFKGASVAMCAYYNNDQVYNRGAYY